ncbi:MAG: hypothetical protein CMH32_03875 [Micavibrio sp.]|nr:hypothetical protein [Micavibrio sp.]HCK32263.1 hypothetical protein [Rhodospirillaceae bacterium]|tara:strand:+ start:1455 stop:1769 length:315 start_codon:yes stop_codon:yes gene_type:complete
MTMTDAKIEQTLDILKTKLVRMRRPAQNEILREHFKESSEGRWTAKNKLALLIALNREQISVQDISDSYQSSIEEVATWIECLNPTARGYGLGSRTIVETRQPR